MKKIRWLIGTVLIIGILGLILIVPLPFLFHHQLSHSWFTGRAIYIILLASFMALYRLLVGPTAADRIVAMDIIGIMLAGFCAILSISTGRYWYIDISIAWALQSFVTTLALAKHMEGKRFDE